MLSRNAQASSRKGARRALRTGGLLLTFAALAAASSAQAALIPGDDRQSIFATGATAPGGIAEGLESPAPSPSRTLVYGDHAAGVSNLVAGQAIVDPLAGPVMPAGANQLAVMEGNLYVVDLSQGVVRVPWNPLLGIAGAWDSAQAVVVPGTDGAQFLADRPTAVVSDGEGNLLVGFIKSGRIARIADPSDTAAITDEYATSSSGLGVSGFAYDETTRTLYLAEADGLSRLVLPDPLGAGAGTASVIPGVDIVPAGGIALDKTGATWPKDPDGADPLNTTKNLLVGTAEGVEQVNLTGHTTGDAPLRRLYATGLQNVSGLHLLTAPLDVSGPNDLDAGTVLAGEDPSAGADGAFGQWVAIAPDEALIPDPPIDAFPHVNITDGTLTTPADLVWSKDDKLYVADHLAGPAQVDLTTSPPTLKPLFDNGIPPEEPGLPASPLDSAGALAFDHFGNLYVTDNAFGPAGSAGLFKIPWDPATNSLNPHETVQIATFIDPARGRSEQPDALAIDRDGNLYVGVARNNTIYKISDLQSDSPTKEFFTTTRSGEPALGLEVDPENRLLVTEGVTVTRFLIDSNEWEGASTPETTDDVWIDLPAGVGRPVLGGPTDLALAPHSLYILDDLEVIQVGLGDGPDRVPDLGSATVRLSGLNIAGGLILDEEGRTRGDIKVDGDAIPEIPAAQDTLIAGTDFLVAEGTGVLKASLTPIGEEGYRTPAIGQVSKVVVTNPSAVIDEAFAGPGGGPLVPKALVSDPGLVDAIEFSLRTGDDTRALVPGTDQAHAAPAFNPDNTFSGSAVNLTGVADGDYFLRATVTRTVGLDTFTEHFDRAVTIDNDYPDPATFANPTAFISRSNAQFTVNDDAFVGVDRVRFWVSENADPLPVAPTRTDTAAPFRLVHSFSPGATTVTVKAEIRFALGRTVTTDPTVFTIDDDLPGIAPIQVVPGLGGTLLAGIGPNGEDVLSGNVLDPASTTVALSSILSDATSGPDPASPSFEIRAGANVRVLATGGSPATFTASWNSASVADLGGDGTRVIAALGKDLAGNPVSVTKTVIVDNVAPQVSVESVIGSTLTVGAVNAGLPIGQVTLTGVNQLGEPLALPVDTAAPFAFTLPAGTWSNLVAHATTGLGTFDSEPVVGTVTIGNAGGGPGLAAVAPPAPLLALAGLRVVGPTGGAITAAGVRGPVAVTFSVNRPATVSFVVSTKSGKVVRTLKRSVKKGKVMLVWNGRDAKGAKVKAGLYRIQVIAVDKAGHRKVVTRTIRVR